jgi:hypothetical protein
MAVCQLDPRDIDLFQTVKQRSTGRAHFQQLLHVLQVPQPLISDPYEPN